MAGLDIRLERKPEGVLVHLSGVVDTSTVENLDRSIQGLKKGNPKAVVVDLSGVDYVNSRGMALFIKHNDALAKAGVRFVLSGLNEKVRPMFEVMGLLEALEVADAPADILRSQEPPKRSVKCPGCAAELPVETAGTFRCSACGTPFRVSKNFSTRALAGKKSSWVRLDLPLKGRFAAIVRQTVMSLAEEHLLEGARIWRVVDEILGALVDSVASKSLPSLELDVVADQDGMKFLILVPGRLKDPEAKVSEALEPLQAEVREAEWLTSDTGTKVLRLSL